MMLALSDPASQPALMHVVVVGQYALLGLGALTVLVWLIRLVRAGRWRQPLRDVICTGQGPSFVQLLLIVGVYHVEVLGRPVDVRGVGLDPVSDWRRRSEASVERLV